MKLIKISAMWCPSCLIMNSRINKYLVDKNVEVIDYDYDIDNEEIKKYNVGKVLPVIIVLDNNKEIKRLVGEYSVKELDKQLGGIL